MKNNFGEELQNLRKKRNMTLEEVSEITNYSVKRIRELEKNNGLPSVDLLNQLSFCYKANLNVYFTNVELNLPQYILSVFPEFRRSIEKADPAKLKFLIDTYSDDENFLTGEGLKIILFSKAFVEKYAENYKLARTYLEQSFAIDNVDINNILTENIYYTYFTFNTLNLYAVVCFLDNEIEITRQILENLNFVFKNTYFNDESLNMYNTKYMIMLFLYNSNNLAYFYLASHREEEALNIINSAITFCHQNYNLEILQLLFTTKLEIYCALKEFEKAKAIADTTISFHKLIDNQAEIDNFVNFLKNKLPDFYDTYVAK